MKKLCKDIDPFKANFKKKLFSQLLDQVSFALVLEYFISQLIQSDVFDRENFETNLLEFESPAQAYRSSNSTSQVFCNYMKLGGSQNQLNKR